MLYAKPLAKVVEATLTWETRGSQKQKEKLLSHVFVLDANKQPLEPVYPGRARFLLTQGKAAVYRRSPFTIILKAAVSSPRVQELRVKIDPGSKTTGLAIVIDVSGKVVWAAQITHRGGCHQASAGSTQSRAPEPQAAQDAVPEATFCESKTSPWMASAFPGKPGGDYHDLGTAAQEIGPGDCALAGVGQVRFPADGEP